MRKLKGQVGAAILNHLTEIILAVLAGVFIFLVVSGLLQKVIGS